MSQTWTIIILHSWDLQKCVACFAWLHIIYGLPSGEESTCQCQRHKRRGFDPWVRKIPWRRKWHPTPVFLSGKIPQTEEPGGLQSTGSQRDGHEWVIDQPTTMLYMVCRPQFHQYLFYGVNKWMRKLSRIKKDPVKARMVRPVAKQHCLASPLFFHAWFGYILSWSPIELMFSIFTLREYFFVW